MRWSLVLAVAIIACVSAPEGAHASPTRSPAPTASPHVTPTPPQSASPRPAPTLQPSPTPRPTLDAHTTELIARLDAWCAEMPRNLSSSPPLDVLGSLADGRTADELAVVLGRSKCLLDADAHGSGDEEIVTAGAYTRLGALLWIDRGFWRIAPVPIDLGYLRFVRDTMVAGVRELLFAIDGGGSGGIGGYVAVGIADGSASITLHMHPSASEMSVRPLDETHLLITGRKLPDRPWGIGSNCCLPDGHEWLYEWTPDGYALVGERQARDPYFALNALLGALDAGRPELARDVATPTALAKASAFFGAGRFWKWTPSGNAAQQEQAELLRWDLLPASTTIEPEPVQYGVARYEPAGPRALVTFERRDGGWVATDVVPAP